MRRLFAVCLLALSCSALFAQGVTIRNKNDPDNPQPSSDTPATAQIWVDTDGGTCVDNASPIEYDSATACATIDAAMDAADAGDTVRVKAGTYNETVTPGANGSDGSPITLVADGAATFCGVTFSSNNYIRVIGFTIDGDGCSRATLITVTATSHHIEFWNNTWRDGSSSGLATSFNAASPIQLNNSIFIGNVMPTMGSAEDNIFYMQGTDNVVAYNDFSNKQCDIANVEGTLRNRWLNNYAHALTSTSGCHTDYWQAGSSTTGWRNNVYDANLQIGSDLTEEHSTNFTNGDSGRCSPSCGTMGENIFRRNVFHQIGTGTIGSAAMSLGAISPYRIYNNTTVNANTYAATHGNSVAPVFIYDGTGPVVYAYNDLHYQSWGASRTSDIYVFYNEGTLNSNYNLAYDPDGSVTFNAAWTNQANEQSNVNPNFVDYANDDFHLGAGSGDGANARGTGGPLTLVNNTNGTGTTFTVDANTGGFFVGSNASNLAQYSGALVPGDTICVGTDFLTVSSVSGDSITVTSSFTWADNDPVYYGDDCSPDIGAYPYKSGGYSLSATYSCNGSTCTITPNDASLVRFVVCYENGVPYAVDNTSTYSCADPTGTFTARVYPLYASTTLWAVATN